MSKFEHIFSLKLFKLKILAIKGVNMKYENAILRRKNTQQG